MIGNILVKSNQMTKLFTRFPLITHYLVSLLKWCRRIQ